MLFSNLALLAAAAGIASATPAPAKGSKACKNGDYAYGGTTFVVTCNAALTKAETSTPVGNATTSSIDDCVQACVNFDNGPSKVGCFSVNFNKKSQLCTFYENIKNGTMHARAYDTAYYAP